MEYIIPFLPFIFILIVFEITTTHVYGKMLSEEEINNILDSHIDEIRLNSLNNSILSWYESFCSTVPFSLRAKWYIHNHGLISKRSPWSKILDNKQKELIHDKENNHTS